MPSKYDKETIERAVRMCAERRAEMSAPASIRELRILVMRMANQLKKSE